MKKIFTKALILALLFLSGASVVAILCLDTDSRPLVFFAERLAFAAICVGSYWAAHKLYKGNLATGR